MGFRGGSGNSWSREVLEVFVDVSFVPDFTAMTATFVGLGLWEWFPGGRADGGIVGHCWIFLSIVFEMLGWR